MTPSSTPVPRLPCCLPTSGGQEARQEYITSPRPLGRGDLGVGSGARPASQAELSDVAERLKAIEVALASFSAAQQASGAASVRGSGLPWQPVTRQFADYQDQGDDTASTLSGEDLATATVVSQALTLVVDPDKNLAFTVFKMSRQA